MDQISVDRRRRSASPSRVSVLRMTLRREWLLVLIGAAIGLLAAAASARGDEVSAPPYAMAGPHPVGIIREDWFDAARNRNVPVKIYFPSDATLPSPVVVFSHGLGNSREGYEYLGRQWASHGFISIHPEHVGAAHDIEKKGLIALYRAGNDRTYWRTFPDDIHFVIDQIARSSIAARADTTRVAVAGHSLGAYAALAEAGLSVPGERPFRDPRVVAGIPISMSEQMPPSAYSKIDIPLLHITGTHDSSLFYGTLPRDRRVPFESINAPDQYLLTIAGANHSTYSDDESPANRRDHDLIRAATTAFLDAFLENDAEARRWLGSGGLGRFAAADARLEMRGVDGATPRIGRITVHTVPLFSADEESHGSFYRVADTLHSATQPALVRDFLLFHEGDVYDAARIAESEKNLRDLDFIKTATIATSAPHDGVVDVDVTTQDEWTTDPNIDFGRDGGVPAWSFNVTQKDLLGRGAEVGITAGRDAERTYRSLELIHPAFLHAYTNLDLLLSKASDGGETKLSVGRPFFSTATRWSYDLTFDRGGRVRRSFLDGVEVARFHENYRDIRALLGAALSSDGSEAHRLLFGAELQDNDFRPLKGADPGDRHFHWLLAGYDYTAPDLMKLDYVDHDARIQDFDLGRHASVLFGYSPLSQSGRPNGEVILQASQGVRLGEHALFLPRAEYSTRYANGVENEIATAEGKLLWRPESALIQTFVARLLVEDGRNLDGDVQYFADGLHGLRGYPAYALSGDKAIVFNAEHRIFLGRELMQLFAPSLAVFFDTGTALPQWQRPGLHDFRSDVGAGLRIAIARAESTVLRLDIAYALNDTPGSKRGLVFSFGTSQAF